LRIERLRGVYTAPPGTLHAGGLKRRLDAMSERETVRLGRLLQQRLNPADESVWLIRKLRVEISADLASLDDSRLGGAWAEAVAGAIWRAVTRGDGEAVRFESSADLDAAFIADLAVGRAWSTWRYDMFASLRSLPAGQAIRRIFERNPARGPAIVAALHRSGGLARALGALSARQARDVWSIVRHSAGDVALAELRAGFERVADTALDSGIDVHDQGKAKLGLLAAVLDRESRLSTPALIEATDLYLVWSRALTDATADPLVQAVAAGTIGQAVAVLRTIGAVEAIEIIPRLIELQLDQATLARAAPAKAPVVCGHDASRALASDFCAAFLLLPAMLDTGAADALDAAGGADAAGALRFLVLAKCFGRIRAAEALDDRVLALAAGAPAGYEAASAVDADAAGSLATAVVAGLAERGHASGRDLLFENVNDSGAAPDATFYAFSGVSGLEWLEPQLDRTLSLAAHAVLRRFAYGLPGFSRSSAEHLAKNFLIGPGAIRLAPEGWQVELPAVPLRIVLKMTGIDGRRFPIPWLDPPHVNLHLTER
jgi:hypothetical protein